VPVRIDWRPDGDVSYSALKVHSPIPEEERQQMSIHALVGRFMISVWPKFYRGTAHFHEFDAIMLIYHTAIRDNVVGPGHRRTQRGKLFHPGAEGL